MDPVVAAGLLAAVATIVAALFAWHAATTNARTTSRNAAQEAAERARREATADLEAARAETQREREEYLELRNRRLEEMANQLGSARMGLAEERQRRKELEAAVKALERRIALCDEQLQEYRRRLADLGEQP
jgi:chromosome segregation ATPase